MNYLSMDAIDTSKVLLLVEASIQAYNAFDKKNPTVCNSAKVIPPDKYDFVECWTGVDAVFNEDKSVETYGVIFRSQQAPYTYIFAFRGTDSTKDLIDDFGFDQTTFVPHNSEAEIPSDLRVEDGFYRIYVDSDGDTQSMQNQLFQLIKKYQASDKKIQELLITGHSLGCTMATLFTLDLALSGLGINALNYNFASPRVGNSTFVDFYEKQTLQQKTSIPTVRFQNVYDKVPCVPLEVQGYQHLPNAYLIAFYRDNITGKFDIVDNHSVQNYKTVLACAFQHGGVCTETFEYDNGKKIKSVKPEPDKVCTYW